MLRTNPDANRFRAVPVAPPGLRMAHKNQEVLSARRFHTSEQQYRGLLEAAQWWRTCVFLSIPGDPGPVHQRTNPWAVTGKMQLKMLFHGIGQKGFKRPFQLTPDH